MSGDGDGERVVEVFTVEWDELVSVVVDPDVHACVIVEELPGGMGRIGAAFRPGLPPDLHDMTTEWVQEKVARFVEHGPDPDGWQRRERDGAWQLWGRVTPMPTLD